MDRPLTTDIMDAIMDLKEVRRQGWLDRTDIKETESVADHTFAVSMITMILADAENLDTGRALRMALLHDIAESITGDITPRQMSREDKKILEKNAMEKIFGMLPDSIQEMYRSLWSEYQRRQTPESVLVHDADAIDLHLQAKRYAKYTDKDIMSLFPCDRQALRRIS